MQQKWVVKCLDTIGDERAKKLKNVKPKLDIIGWRKNEPHKDHTIFMMRHMETFMGVQTNNWKCGLEDDDEEQRWQIKMLRYKYATKILLSDLNQRRIFVLKEVKDFAKLPREEVLKKGKRAEEIKVARLESLV